MLVVRLLFLRVEYLDGSERIYCHSLDTVIYFLDRIRWGIARFLKEITSG